MREAGSHVSFIIYLFIKERLLHTLYKQTQHATQISGNFMSLFHPPPQYFKLVRILSEFTANKARLVV
jgi:DNA gyrase/topoisomerase IV subunit A